MTLKFKSKIVLDIIMFILLLLCMSYSLIGTKWHEYLGIILCIGFIIHCILQKNYFAKIISLKYTLYNSFILIINLLTFLTMFGLIISSLIFLDYIPLFLKTSFPNLINFARTLHLLSAYWGFILISMHIGLHWQIFYNLITKYTKDKLSYSLNSKLILWIIFLYGLNNFIHYDLISYMLLQNNFVYFNPSQSLLSFFVDYLSIVVTFIILANYLRKSFLNLQTKDCILSHILYKLDKKLNIQEVIIMKKNLFTAKFIINDLFSNGLQCSSRTNSR